MTLRLNGGGWMQMAMLELLLLALAKVFVDFLWDESENGLWYASWCFWIMAAWWWRIYSSLVKLQVLWEFDVYIVKRKGSKCAAVARQPSTMPLWFIDSHQQPLILACSVKAYPNLIVWVPRWVGLFIQLSCNIMRVSGSLTAADMLKFTITMQRGVLQRKSCSSETGDDMFEEEVSMSKLIRFTLHLLDVLRWNLPSAGVRDSQCARVRLHSTPGARGEQ